MSPVHTDWQRHPLIRPMAAILGDQVHDELICRLIE